MPDLSQKIVYAVFSSHNTLILELLNSMKPSRFSASMFNNTIQKSSSHKTIFQSQVYMDLFFFRCVFDAVLKNISPIISISLGGNQADQRRNPRPSAVCSQTFPHTLHFIINNYHMMLVCVEKNPLVHICLTNSYNTPLPY